MISNHTDPWVIVLAGGEGSRLRRLTTDANGRSVPKQFCSLEGGPTLLEQTFERAWAISNPGRVLTIVAHDHRELWEPLFRDPHQEPLLQENVISQPANRGTAAGVLLPLVTALARDPNARVAILPSDHHVQSERSLRVALLEALNDLERGDERIILLGVTPDGPVGDYGWIVPRKGFGRLRRIDRFVEKPGPAASEELYRAGGLWNSFLIAAEGEALLELAERRLPRLVAQFRALDVDDPEAIAALYERIETSDFSCDVLQEGVDELAVLEVPPCGWTDLGTPQRVAECLQGRVGSRRRQRPVSPNVPVLAGAIDDAHTVGAWAGRSRKEG